jgi:hypothetical protein
MHECCGKIEDNVTLFSKRTFVVLDWPTEGISFSFDTMGEAKNFISDVSKSAASVPLIRLYGFVGGEWKRL